MALTAAQKNKRKRERKKREREAEKQRLLEQEQDAVSNKRAKTEEAEDDVEIEYVAEPLSFPLAGVGDNGVGVNMEEDGGVSTENGKNVAAPDGGDGAPVEQAADDGDDLQAVMRRFQDRSAVVYVTDEEQANNNELSDKLLNEDAAGDEEEDDDEMANLSKRKLKDMLRPTVAQLKQRVHHPELVEAHDVTAPDPHFLIYLKGISGTVPVPRHWGRKRKYLQGKRGVEKPPFALPDFIVKTGICDVRDATAEDEAKQSIKQKNRSRVSGRGGGVDVDYRTLYEAFFRHQTKPEKMTDFGDLYYEGKEYETTKSSNFRPGYMSERLREALGMPNEYSPPPWLINMQRYGPPPSYPNARIPGLNAPLPTGASYGYHVGGWGKPPVDAFGRPLYGGDPFGSPEVQKDMEEENEDLYGLSAGGSLAAAGGMITSDGKAIGKKTWGGLPSAFGDDEDEEGEEEESSSEEEESSDEEMEESEEEEGEMPAPPAVAEGGVPVRAPGMDSILPDGVDSVVPSSAIDLRKPGDETPMIGEAPKQLYTVLQQTTANKDAQATSVFASDHAYVLPGAGPGSGMPEGAASVLSKSVAGGDARKARLKKDDEDEADELGKKFKF